MLRVAWNKKNMFYLATIQQNSNDVTIIDVRYPMKAVRTLKSHLAQVNSIAWAPHSQSHICTAGDDKQTLIWCLNSQDAPVNVTAPDGQPLSFDEPYLSYNADGPVH